MSCHRVTAFDFSGVLPTQVIQRLEERVEDLTWVAVSIVRPAVAAASPYPRNTRDNRIYLYKPLRAKRKARKEGPFDLATNFHPGDRFLVFPIRDIVLWLPTQGSTGGDGGHKQALKSARVGTTSQKPQRKSARQLRESKDESAPSPSTFSSYENIVRR